MIAINNTVPKKFIISSLSVKKEKECISSSKYQMKMAIKNDIITSITGKIRQHNLFCFIWFCFSFKKIYKSLLVL